MLFLYIDVDSKTPSVLSSVKINIDLTLEITVRNTSVPTAKFRHLLQDHKKVIMISEVLNVLAEVKSLASGESSGSDLLQQKKFYMIFSRAFIIEMCTFFYCK